MGYGIVEYDEDGNPKCEICGKHFIRVINHARQKHKISEREYKLQFGLDLQKGICSKESSEKSRNKVYDNYDKCIGKNLLILGENKRFKIGSEGRTKEKVSEQTRISLTTHAKSNLTLDVRQKIGKAVGLSGLGNKKRWGK